MKPFFDTSLPNQQKISKNQEFKSLLVNGKKVFSENFDIIYSYNNLGYPRIGYVVGKRVSNKAVKRNRIKRLLREFFRYNKSKLDSNDVIIIAKKDISSFSLNTVVREISNSADFTEQ